MIFPDKLDWPFLDWITEVLEERNVVEGMSGFYYNILYKYFMKLNLEMHFTFPASKWTKSSKHMCYLMTLTS